MALISFDKDTVIDYVPEYANNRDSDDPCVVRLKFVSYARVQHYARMISAKANGKGGQKRGAEIVQEIQRRQFTENVESVSNFSIDGVDITDPSDLYDTADSDLIVEIIQAMESSYRLSEGQLKN